MNGLPGPFVIAGVGGSGTRVFTRIARAAGRHMGDRVNESDDALDLMDFADNWLRPYHEARLAGGRPAREADMRGELEASLARHREGAGENEPWGWKQPRSIHFLPFLHETLPELRFLHVVRDGRDVAFGRQATTVLENAGDALLDAGWRERPVPVTLIELWSVANLLAADYGEKSMGDGYLRVRFEDLCRAPAAVAARVAAFAGARDPSGKEVQDVAREVRWPTSIGVWRREDPTIAAQVERSGEAALAMFGYAGTRFRRPLADRARSATRRLHPS